MPTPDAQNVGLIGVGLLGSAIADRLIRAGFVVHGYDPSRDAMAAFADSGGHPASDIDSVFEAADRILLCLPNSGVVTDVLDAAHSALRSGTTIVDTTTGDPHQTRSLAARLQSKHATLIDACVLASSVETRQGQAVLMVGASDEVLRNCRDILLAITDRIHHVGPVGAGQEMKLVANLVLGLNRAALAEGLSFAQSFSLNPQAVLDVLKAGVAYSQVMDTKGQKMLNADFSPQARLSQHLKDVRLILKHAESQQLTLPLSHTHRGLLEKVEADGYGQLDNSAVIKAWQSDTTNQPDTPRQ